MASTIQDAKEMFIEWVELYAVPRVYRAAEGSKTHLSKSKRNILSNRVY